MKLRWPLTAVALVAAVCLAVPAGAAIRANSQTFPDSTGEDANAPDITSVVASNDDNGQITFQVNISNRPALTPDMVILIFLDTDANPATGSADFDGADYALDLETGGVFLDKWTGSTFDSTPDSTVVRGYSPTGAMLGVNKSELGGTTHFNFYVAADSGIVLTNGVPDFTNEHTDLAPDPNHDSYVYDVKVTPKVTPPTTKPKAKPKPKPKKKAKPKPKPKKK
jgi:hypothetical protein